MMANANIVDPLHHTKSWRAGDLLVVRRSARDGAVSFTEAGFQEYLTRGYSPNGFLLARENPLFLGEIRLCERHHFKSFYAKCWWNNQILWVDVTNLRLVTQGKK